MYKILKTEELEEDISLYYNYLFFELENERSADSLVSNIDTALMVLQVDPYTYQLFHDEDIAKMGYRSVLIKKTHLLFYRVFDDKSVLAARLLNAKMDFKRILK